MQIFLTTGKKSWYQIHLNLQLNIWHLNALRCKKKKPIVEKVMWNVKKDLTDENYIMTFFRVDHLIGQILPVQFHLPVNYVSQVNVIIMLLL